MDRDQLIKEIIFDKLLKKTDNNNSVRRLRVSVSHPKNIDLFG